MKGFRQVPAIPGPRGMTLLEILVSTAVIGIVLLLIAQTITTMQNTWVKVRAKADGYRTTRLALDTVARRISQATLSPRWHMDDSVSPAKYRPESDLHFVCGPALNVVGRQSNVVGHAVFFQAPFGYDDAINATDSKTVGLEKMNATLNAWGYFVEYGTDLNQRPDFMAQDPQRFPERHRFRLLEFRQPARELTLFDMKPGNPATLALNSASSEDQLFSWFRQPLQSGATYQQRHLTVIAENILALIIMPADPKQRAANSDLSTTAPFVGQLAQWNSRSFQMPRLSGAATDEDLERHQMPPAVQLTAIALSEDAWLSYTENAQIDALAGQLTTAINERFQDGKNFADDIAYIQGMLDAKRPVIPYRIVSIMVPLSQH